MSDKEKRVTAYHEAGHALTAWAMPNLDPVHKVTILPRGRSLGHTLVLPLEDRYTQTRAEILDQLVYALGGRAAEELVFHEPTTGASNDIEKATELARAMVTEYGMSAKLGAVKYGTGDAEPFMGRDYGHQRDYSEDIAADIDAEVRELIEAAHDEAWEILVQYRDVLDAMVLELVEKETLEQGGPRADPRRRCASGRRTTRSPGSASARRATVRRSRSRYRRGRTDAATPRRPGTARPAAHTRVRAARTASRAAVRSADARPAAGTASRVGLPEPGRATAAAGAGNGSPAGYGVPPSPATASRRIRRPAAAGTSPAGSPYPPPAALAEQRPGPDGGTAGSRDAGGSRPDGVDLPARRPPCASCCSRSARTPTARA